MGPRMLVLFVIVSLLNLTSFASGQSCNSTFTPPKAGTTIEIAAAGANCNVNTAPTPCNDTGIFQAALTYLRQNGGGVISLPSGKTCAANIEIDSNTAGSSICIAGRGRRSSFLTPYNGGSPVITISSAQGSLGGITLDNFGIKNRLGADGINGATGLYITGTNIDDNHLFERLYIGGNGTQPAFVNGIKVNGRLIASQLWDIEVDGATGDACQFDSSATGGVMNHDSFRDLQCNGSTGGWGIWVKAPPATPFHTFEFDHVNAQGNHQGGIYLNGVEEGGLYNSYIENNGSNCSPACPDGYGVKIEGTYARAFNIVGNLIWGSGTSVYNHATLTQGSYTGNLAAGDRLDFDINTPDARSSILIGQNYSSKCKLVGNVVVAPSGPGTVTPH